jgi:hypothetical protein
MFLEAATGRQNASLQILTLSSWICKRVWEPVPFRNTEESILPSYCLEMGVTLALGSQDYSSPLKPLHMELLSLGGTPDALWCHRATVTGPPPPFCHLLCWAVIASLFLARHYRAIS